MMPSLFFMPRVTPTSKSIFHTGSKNVKQEHFADLVPNHNSEYCDPFIPPWLRYPASRPPPPPITGGVDQSRPTHQADPDRPWGPNNVKVWRLLQAEEKTTCLCLPTPIASRCLPHPQTPSQMATVNSRFGACRLWWMGLGVGSRCLTPPLARGLCQDNWRDPGSGSALDRSMPGSGGGQTCCVCAMAG